jgi:secreted PhoX family phosphatase
MLKTNSKTGGNMKRKESTSLMAEFLGSSGFSRRSFLKATAAGGAAVALGNGILPEMKALAAAAADPESTQGQWLPATCRKSEKTTFT